MRLLVPLLALVLAPSAWAAPPVTGFEQRNGATFTTFEEEQAFLAAVDEGSARATVSEIGRTEQGRPVQLVEVAAPGPGGASRSHSRPTAMLVCTQHGNEPAGREACLQLLRDLAFTEDAARVALLERVKYIFVPTANPDGRAANDRENSSGVDVNRDHLGLETPEARAIAQVVLDHAPDVLIDLHEYGPSQPVVYDDSVLWLWPRNLNTDAAVHDAAVALGRDYLVPAVEAEGYTADEYGQAEVVDNDVAQTAGDADEGILRNAMGLRHVLGILAETRVDGDPRQSPAELVDTAAVQRRRVASHMALLAGLERFMTERGAGAAALTAAAAERKTAEGAARSAPVYFGGADNMEPAPGQAVTPPPCSYELTAAHLAALGPRLGLHGIAGTPSGGDGLIVGLGQPAEPLIPLLLDARGTRHVVEGKASENCPPPTRPPAGAGPPKAPGKGCVRRRQVVLAVPRGRLVRVRANGRRVRARKRAVVVDLRRFKGRTVRMRFTMRRGGRTLRITRKLRICRR